MSLHGVDLRPAFVDLFTKELGLSPSEFERVTDRFHVKHVPKRRFHLQAGDVNIDKAYVNKGCSRSFTLDARGKEHILFFGFEDWWLADYESFTSGRPAKQSIQAIEDLELLCIARRDWEDLSERIPALKRWYEVRQMKMVFRMIERLIEVKSCTPEERLVALVKQRSDIFQRVALQDIASYLDIEPPSLSRMRRRVLAAERGS